MFWLSTASRLLPFTLVATSNFLITAWNSCWLWRDQVKTFYISSCAVPALQIWTTFNLAWPTSTEANNHSLTWQQQVHTMQAAVITWLWLLCACYFHITTMCCLTDTLPSDTAGGLRAWTLLPCAYVRSFTRDNAKSNKYLFYKWHKNVITRINLSEVNCKNQTGLSSDFNFH